MYSQSLGRHLRSRVLIRPSTRPFSLLDSLKAFLDKKSQAIPPEPPAPIESQPPSVPDYDLDQANLDKLKELKESEEVTAWTFEEAKQLDIRSELLISDLERERMARLDALIGTNTHFHEIASYEERLDSETVLAKTLLQKSEPTVGLDVNQYLDPQRDRKMPRFINFAKYVQEAQQFKTLPEHRAEPHDFASPHEQLIDRYKYLDDLHDHSPASQVTLQKKFEFHEKLYSDISLLKNTRIEDKLSSAYFRRADCFNAIPLWIGKWKYYQQDQNLSAGSPQDLYQESPQGKQQLALSQKEVADHLHHLAFTDSTVEQFLSRFDLNKFQYDHLFFNKNHSLMGICMELSPDKGCLIMFKSMDQGEFCSTYLLDSLLYPQFWGSKVAYVKRGSSNQQLVLYDLDTKEENIVYNGQNEEQLEILQQKNSLFQIFSVWNPLSGQHSFYARRDQGEFTLLLTNEQGEGKYTVQVGERAIYFTKDIESNSLYQIKIVDHNTQNQQQTSLLEDHLKDQEANKKERLPGTQGFLYTTDHMMAISEDSQTNCLQEILGMELYPPEVIYQTESTERVLDFEAFENFLALRIEENLQQKFLILIIKSGKWHSLKMNQPYYLLTKESPQDYQSSLLRFATESPTQLLQIKTYHYALRQDECVYAQRFNGFDQADLVEEEVLLGTTKVLLVYCRDAIRDDPPFIMMAKQRGKEINRLDDLILKNEHVGLFEKGVVLAYPLGLTLENGVQQLEEALRMIISKKLSRKVLGYADGALPGYLLSQCLIKNNSLFTGCVIHNGILDPLEQFNQDSPKGYFEITQENYGIFKDNSIFFKGEPPLIDNLLLTYDTNSVLAHQSRKFMAYMREQPLNTHVFLQTFSPDDLPLQRTLVHQSYLVNLAQGNR